MLGTSCFEVEPVGVVAAASGCWSDLLETGSSAAPFVGCDLALSEASLSAVAFGGGSCALGLFARRIVTPQHRNNRSR